MLTKEQEATWKFNVEHKNDPNLQKDINPLWPKTGTLITSNFSDTNFGENIFGEINFGNILEIDRIFGENIRRNFQNLFQFR